LVDTDVLIWYLKGNLLARDTINNLSGFCISVVTHMELVQGMRNKQELGQLRRALKSWLVKVLYVSEDISIKALFYVEQQYLSHAVQLADALIAATAVTHGLDLMTAKIKHYKILKDVSLKVFKPIHL